MFSFQQRSRSSFVACVLDTVVFKAGHKCSPGWWTSSQLCPYDALDLLQRGGCYLCYAGRETGALQSYFDPRGLQCFHQAWQGSVLHLCCVFGLGELGKKSLHRGCFKAQELSTPTICFLPSEQGEQHKEPLQKLHHRVAARALLPAAVCEPQHLSCPRAGERSCRHSRWHCSLPGATRIHCSAQHCFWGIKLGFSIIGSLPFSVYRGLFFLPFLASSPAGILSGNTVRCSRLTVIPSSALLNRRREGGLHQALLGQRTFQLLN